MLIGAPELHHWHHDRDRDAGNYANISPLMDVLFGTYRCPDHEPERFGIHEPSPATYVGHLVEPLLPQWKPTNAVRFPMECGDSSPPALSHRLHETSDAAPAQ
jgi:hypothetical protein